MAGKDRQTTHAPPAPPGVSVDALMASRELMVLFKFRSDRTFRRAAAAQRLPVRVFQLPGRRGWFAKTDDVRLWLTQVGNGPTNQPKEVTP